VLRKGLSFKMGIHIGMPLLVFWFFGFFFFFFFLGPTFFIFAYLLIIFFDFFKTVAEQIRNADYGPGVARSPPGRHFFVFSISFYFIVFNTKPKSTADPIIEKNPETRMMDYRGPGVSHAALMAALVDPGRIMMDTVVYKKTMELMKSVDPFSIQSLGPVLLKKDTDIVDVYEV
jgi:hypothetical protein